MLSLKSKFNLTLFPGSLAFHDVGDVGKSISQHCLYFKKFTEQKTEKLCKTMVKVSAVFFVQV